MGFNAKALTLFYRSIMKKLQLYFSLVSICFLLAVQSLIAQDLLKVTGTVTDKKRSIPLRGVTIKVRGEQKGQITGADGKYSFDLQKGQVLEFASIGFKPRRVTVENSTAYDIAMDEDIVLLEEAVVVGYGSVSKKSFVGSAGTVSAKALEARPITNVSQALIGAVSGVQVLAGSGQPGQGADVRIRGFGSINASSAPLYVVDGTIFNGNLADISAQDIESLTVLKDAASTAIYGASSGNGVILIQTKKGQGAGVPSITFSTSHGLSSRAIPEYERVGIYDYYPAMWTQLRNGFIYSDGLTVDAANARATTGIYDLLRYNPFKGVANNQIVIGGSLNPAAKELLYGDDTDWDKALSRTGYRQEYNLSLGNKAGNWETYASMGYLNENGYSIRTNYERFSGRGNITYTPTTWMKTGINLSVFRVASQNAADGSSTGYVNPFFFTRFLGPIYPIHEHDDVTGAYVLDGQGNKVYDFRKTRGAAGSSGRHVLAETMLNNRVFGRDGLNARTFLELTLFEGLKLTTNVGYDISNSANSLYTNRIVGDAQGSGRIFKSQARSTTLTVNELLEYNTTIADKHSIGALIAHENYYYTYQYLDAQKSSQILNGIEEFADFVINDGSNSYLDSYTKESFFGRLSYDYDSKYYASFAYRKDGTSRFDPAMRWGDFWSAGAAWRITQEEFMRSADWISNLKLRASYGETGNDQLIDADGNALFYPYKGLFGLGYNNYTDPGILLTVFGNSKLKWETQVTSDIALEFAFLNNMIRGTVEVFNKESRDLLFNVPLPLSSGGTSISQNIGKVQNKGLEFDVEADIISDKSFRWTIGGNATFIKNEIVQLPEGQSEIITGTKKYIVGVSRFEYWLRDYRGVDSKDGAALYTFDGVNQRYSATTERIVGSDTLTTSLPKALFKYQGNSIPIVTGGFTTSFQYEGLSLAIVFAYQLGGKTYDNGYGSLMSQNQMGGALHVDALNKSWKKEGDITTVPRLDARRAADFDGQSSRWLISSDALVLKSVVLGYALPGNIAEALFVKSARINLSAENLFFWTARTGLNSLQSFTGVGVNGYTSSPARTLTVGLQVGF